MKRLINKLKKIRNNFLFLLQNEIGHELARIENEQVILSFSIREINEIISKDMKIGVDVHMQTDVSHAILIGKWNRQDYVRIFPIEHKHMQELVKILKGLEMKYPHARYEFDAPFDIARNIKEQLR